MILPGRYLGCRADLTKQVLLVMSWFAFLFFALSANSAQNADSSTALYKIKRAIIDIHVGTTEQNKRVVNLVVSYPSGASDYPLIVFSHGHALDNKSYNNLTDYWVERGYFVVAPLHLDSGGDLAGMSDITEKYGRDWIAASRLLEMKAVIDQIANIVSSLDDFQGSVSTDQIIAAGHSYGALSSQQLSGAKVELSGDSIYPLPASFVDDRVVAVVAISPPGLMKEHLTEATWQGYDTPQLVVTGPNDFFPFIWPNYEEHFVSYLTAEPGSNYLLVLDEMDHYLGNLIGRLERDGPPQRLALQNLQEVSLMFIKSYLSLDTSARGIEKLSQLSDTTDINKRDGILRYEHR